MRSICFFSSYYTAKCIPYYVKAYLSELVRHFDKVVLITNNKQLTSDDEQVLKKNNIELLLVKNEGYDFGMWYKAINTHSYLQYDRIGLINDSCILFKKLDDVFEVINKSDWDYCGILDSAQILYHCQSYFIIINKRAIPHMITYFMQNGIIQEFDKAIETYEVGISRYMLEKNLKIGSVFSHEIDRYNLNPSYFSIEKLLAAGFPLIKKKIIFGNFRRQDYTYLKHWGFNFNADYYLSIIKKYNQQLLLDLSLLRKDYKPIKRRLRLFRFDVYYFSGKIYRKLISLISG